MKSKEYIKKRIENCKDIQKTSGVAAFVYMQEQIDNYKKVLEDLELLEKIKELMKWKSVAEYDSKKYDWVLVKLKDDKYIYDLPHIAEKTIDNKWRDLEGNIIDSFEVVEWRSIDIEYELREWLIHE